MVFCRMGGTSSGVSRVTQEDTVIQGYAIPAKVLA